MRLKYEIRQLFRKFGYDLERFAPRHHPLARRKKLLETYGIDTVLDVGANRGDFGVELRNELAYTKRILSFEPLSSAFQRLVARSKGDPDWTAYNWGFGDENKKQDINVAANSHSSSLLGMLPAHAESSPDSKYIGVESIELKTIDSVFEDLCGSAKGVYLKIDTQGFEDRVLRGASQSLPRISAIQMELSLVPLYDGAILFEESCSLVRSLGYKLVSIETGFSDAKTGEMLQCDGIFHRI